FVFHVVVLVLVRLCCITTLVATLLFSENLTPFTLSFCAGTSAIALLHPTIGEFFSLCRRCGLWSHRAYQIDGFCPGCAKLALKSRKQFQSRTRFHSAREFLKKIDRGLERMAITKRRPK
ncbi:MAG: hypothetical protein KDD60_10835, partial [Bdellovibrionales bacterium]|nr:hypothetical protein [Bdellovibrionales bacterium]